MPPALALLLPPTLPPTVTVGPDDTLLVWTAEQAWHVDGDDLLSVTRWRERGAPSRVGAGGAVWEIGEGGVSRDGAVVLSKRVRDAVADGDTLWVLAGDEFHHLPQGTAFAAPGAQSVAVLPDGVAIGRRDAIDVRTREGALRCTAELGAQMEAGVAADGSWIAAVTRTKVLALVDATTCAVHAAITGVSGEPAFVGDRVYVVDGGRWASWSVPDLRPTGGRPLAPAPFDLRVEPGGASLVDADPAGTDEPGRLVRSPRGVVRAVAGPGGPGPRLRVHPRGVVAWDPSTGHDLGVPLPATPDHADVSADGRLAVTLTGDVVEAWATATGARLWTTTAPPAKGHPDRSIRVEGGAVVWRGRERLASWRASDGAPLWSARVEGFDGVRFIEVTTSEGTWRPHGPPGTLLAAPPFPGASPDLPAPAPGGPADDVLARLDVTDPAAPSPTRRLEVACGAQDLLVEVPALAEARRAWLAEACAPAEAPAGAPWPATARAPLAFAPPRPFPAPPEGEDIYVASVYGGLDLLGALAGPRPARLVIRWAVPEPAARRRPRTVEDARLALRDPRASVTMDLEPPPPAEGRATLQALDGPVLVEGTPAEVRRALARVGLERVDRPLPRRALAPRWRYVPPEPALGLVALGEGRVAVRTADHVAALGEDGRLLWSMRLQADELVATGGVLLARSRREVIAVDAATGARAWSIAKGQVHAASDGLAWVEDGDSSYLVDAATGTRRWDAPPGRGRFSGDALVVQVGGLACTRALADGAFRGCVVGAPDPVEVGLGDGTLRADGTAWVTDGWRLDAGVDPARDAVAGDGWAAVRLGSHGGDWVVVKRDGRLGRWLGPGEAAAAEGHDAYLVVDGGVQAWRVR